LNDLECSIAVDGRRRETGTWSDESVNNAGVDRNTGKVEPESDIWPVTVIFCGNVTDGALDVSCGGGVIVFLNEGMRLKLNFAKGPVFSIYKKKHSK
jgi:hypothetical protein